MFSRTVEHRECKVPEIVAHGKTGFVVDSLDRMAEAVKAIHLIDPSDCRKHVKKYFSINSMARQYSDLYQRIVGERTVCQKTVLSQMA